MVLESLRDTTSLKRRPVSIFLIASVVTLISSAVAYIFFPLNTGMVLVFLIVIGMLPVFQNILKMEYDDEYKKMGFFTRHSRIIEDYAAFFFGVAITISIVGTLGTENIVNSLFGIQINEIEATRSILSGNFFIDTTFGKILSNNIQIVFLAFLLSFMFGTGALFVLSWNATILGALVFSLVRVNGVIGFTGFLAFLPHGILEIGGFFLSGIAAGLMSRAIFNYKSDLFKHVMLDSLKIFLLSIILIVAAAGIEVLFV